MRGSGETGRRRGRILAVVLWIAVAGAGSWWRPVEASAAAIANADCMVCHADSSMVRSTGSPPASVFVDAFHLRSSVHGALSCQTCHPGITAIPHEPRVRTLSCETCHQKAAAAVQGGAHRAAQAGRARGCVACHGEAHVVRAPATLTLATCTTCHAKVVQGFTNGTHARGDVMGTTKAACERCHGATHAILAHTDPRAPTARAKIVDMCASCHGDRQLMMKRKIAIPAAYELFRKSVHGRSTNPRAAICSDCHGSHEVRRAADPLSTVYRTSIPSTCGQCHDKERRAYDASVHGRAVTRGVTEAPVCTDCHGEHLIRGPKDAGSPVSPTAVTRTCAHCHEAQGIRETYGLAAGRLSTYQDSYHGLAARGGSPVVANCASCHGVHDILPSSDPRSAINVRNLPVTCGKCHPGIGAQATITRVHVAMATPDQPALYWVRRAYIWLIVLVISGMLAHNTLNMMRMIRDRWRAAEHAPGEPEEEDILDGPPHVRLTFIERVQHWLLMTSFFVLVYTGFALRFPESWPFAWLARAEQGYSWRSSVHRGAAIVMVAVTLLHVGYLFTRRGRAALAAGVPRLQDVRDLGANLLYFMGLRAKPPAFDRFNYIEKAEYWALVWGTIVMTVTGGLLWFENTTMRVFGNVAADLSTIVHYYEAWLAFLAIVVWHLFYTIFSPEVYPMDWTWLTGRVPARRERHERPLEWARLQEEAARAAEEEAEAARRAAAEAETPPPNSPAPPESPAV